MNNKNYLPIKILHLVLMFGALLGSCYVLYHNLSLAGFHTYMFASGISPIIAIVFGLYYFFKGYKKNAAVYYKLFMAFFLLEFVLSVLAGMTSSRVQYEYLPAIADLTTLVSISLLYFGRDLGKTRSSVLAIIIVICRIVMLVLTFTASAQDMNDLFARSGVIIYVIRLLTDVLLAGSAGLMVYGKYVDKESRGAK